MEVGERAVVGHEHGRDDLVADGEGLAGEVAHAGRAEGDDLARALVAEHDRDEFERVAFVFVHVGAADAAGLDAHEQFAGPEIGQGEVARLESPGTGEHGGAGHGRKGGRCGHRARSIGERRGGGLRGSWPKRVARRGVLPVIVALGVWRFPGAG